jgi:dipeptidyl aminopeptidase/acylaminoacyl peptidase
MSAPEEVRIASGDAILAGSLYRPPGAEPHPAVIMLQGSGPADRDSLGYFPPLRQMFIDSGLAVLAWDRPGIGASSGDWRQRTLHDRATEALDALAWLRERDGIDPARVGIWGHSQGGWVGPLAASQTAPGHLAFLVINSGPGIDPHAQDEYGIEHTLRRDGHGDAAVADALAFIRAIHAAALRAAPHDEVTAILDAARGTSWGEYFGEVDPATWGFFVVNARHPIDPVAALERITCPVLALFGAADPLVPAIASADIFTRAFARSGNTTAQIVIFPGADHRIRTDDPHGFAPHYLDTLSDWVRRRVGLG